MNTKAKTTIQWHYRQAINLRLGTIGNEGLEVLIWTQVNGTRFMALINHLYTVHPWFYVVDTYNIIAKTNHYTNIKFPLTKKNVFILYKTLFRYYPNSSYNRFHKLSISDSTLRENCLLYEPRPQQQCQPMI